jgi:hypothetical protein
MDPRQPQTTGTPTQPTPQEGGVVTGVPMQQAQPSPTYQDAATLLNQANSIGVSDTATPAASEEEADNEDQLDEMWVAKAREIVEQTKDDPYKQTRAISRIKADFLKSRYQKELKVNEES